MNTCKIKSIKKVSCNKTPVYDINVPIYHNFVLANGLVVHNCVPYQYFRSTIYEKRIEMYNDKILISELIDLERNIDTGKVDHPDGGAKDVADAVCLAADTKIFTLDGQNNTIRELYDLQQENKLNNKWVLSYDIDNQKFIPVEIQEIVNNGYKDNLIKLILDNGEQLICTRDHLILNRDGCYIKAEDTLNISLMPFSYENKLMFKNRDYLYIYEPKNDLTSEGKYLHKIVAEDIYSENKAIKEATKKEKEWIVIHHKDCDRLNNNPNNLIYLTNTEHSRIHISLNTSKLKKQQLREANKKRIEAGEHPFIKMSYEQRRQNGHKALVNLNKSEKHRKAVSANNLKLASEGKLSFQLNKANSHTPEANAKRDTTCKLLYEGTGFKSDMIQEKCRQSCLKNNGYDNPFCSIEKQNEMRKNKIIKTIDLVYNNLGLDKKEPLSYMDLRIELYKLNKQIKCDITTLTSLGYNIDATNYIDKEYEKLRNKGTCIRMFIKQTGKQNFTYEEFSNFYEEHFNNYIPSKGAGNFKFRFKDKPSYLDILKLGFNVYNHRVVKIEEVPGAEVFDIKLPKIHNFALTNGLIVHNCGAVFNASKHAEEFAYDYGEQAEDILRLNSEEFDNDNLKQLTVNLEQELLAMGKERLHPSDITALTKTDDYNLYDDIIIL